MRTELDVKTVTYTLDLCIPVSGRYRLRPELDGSKSGQETYGDVLKEVDWIVIDVIGDEIVVGHGQEGHLRDGENIHELLYFRPLCAENELN